MRAIRSTPTSQPRNLTIAQLNRQLSKIDVGSIHRRDRERVLPRYPRGLRRSLMCSYLGEANTRPPGLPGWSRKPWMAASNRLLARHAAFRHARFDIAFDVDELELKARYCAQTCLNLMRNQDAVTGYAAAAVYASEQDIVPPSLVTPNRTVDGCRRRLCDPAWWQRNLKRMSYRATEAVERDNGLVQAVAGLDASDDAVERRTFDKVRSSAFLEETMVVNDSGECLSLADIADSTNSNPAIRRAELMVRLSGFEEYAATTGDGSYFITLTVPSRFHAYRRTGHQNAKYDGSDPAAA